MNKNKMNRDKGAIITKVFESAVGALEIAYNDVKENTKPCLYSLNKKAKNVDELIELLLNSKILQTQLTITETKEKWDITQESFLQFIQNNTTCNFVFESLKDYIIKTNNDHSQNSIMIEFNTLSNERKQELSKWLSTS